MNARWLADASGLIVLAYVQSGMAQTPAALPAAIPFDVTNAGSAEETTIVVLEKRPYRLDLNLYYGGQQDLDKVRRLAGDAARFADGRYVEPGTIAVVHVTVDEEDGGASAVHYDKTTSTQGHYLHGFEATGGGYYARSIGAVVLGPGRYRIRAEAMVGVPGLHGIETRLSITYDPRAAPLKE
jgi:hypothetical protein